MKLNPNPHRKYSSLGFGLIELMITLAVGALACLLAAQMYGLITRWFKAEGDKNRSVAVAKEVGNLLHSRLDGGKAFQNLNFYIPNSGNPGFQSMGPGIYILPNRGMANGVPDTVTPLAPVNDANGNALVQSMLYLAAKKDSGASLPLIMAAFGSGDTNTFGGDIQGLSGNDLVQALTSFIDQQTQLHTLAAGNFVAFSSVQTSDMALLKSTSVPSWLTNKYNTVSAQMQALVPPRVLPADILQFDFNFSLLAANRSYNSPTFLYSNTDYNQTLTTLKSRIAAYVGGDFLSRAEITAIGLDPNTNNGQLTARALSTGVVSILAQNVKSFSVSYTLKCDPAANTCFINKACPSLDFSKHTEWSVINASPLCYQAIDSLHLNILLKPPVGADPNLILSSDLDFPLN